MSPKITPTGDPYLYYIAGDDVCKTSGQYANADAAVEAFEEEYPERSATYAMGVKDDSKGSIDGNVVWNSDEEDDADGNQEEA